MQSIGMHLLAITLRDNRLGDFVKFNPAFFVQDEKKVYKFIKTHVDNYGTLPSLSLSIQKSDLVKPKQRDTYGYFFDEVYNRALYNKLITLMGRVNPMLLAQDGVGAYSVIKEFVEATYNLHAASNQTDLKTMQELADPLLEDIENTRHTGGMTGVPTG